MSPKKTVWRGVATMSRLLTMIGLFCQRALQKRLYSAKETYVSQEDCALGRHSTVLERRVYTDGSLLPKSPTKETIFCKRDLCLPRGLCSWETLYSPRETCVHLECVPRKLSLEEHDTASQRVSETVSSFEKTHTLMSPEKTVWGGYD